MAEWPWLVFVFVTGWCLGRWVTGKRGWALLPALTTAALALVFSAGRLPDLSLVFPSESHTASAAGAALVMLWGVSRLKGLGWRVGLVSVLVPLFVELGLPFGLLLFSLAFRIQ